VAKASSLTAFQSATGSSWYFDATAHALYLKVKHVSTSATATVKF
jgi:hypothetical protein